MTQRILVPILCLSLLAGPVAADDFFVRDSLTGDWDGARGALAQSGFQLGGDEILDVMGNPSGGRKQGLAAEGRLELFATIDLGTALGWNGMLAHANAYQIHGRGLSTDDIGNILTVGNIGATPATRLFTAWLQQSLFDDTLSIRAGQIAADDEFFVSQYATLFVNSAFGWPSILGINLPSGGPAYPLATPGVRVRAALSPALTLSGAVFNGDPAPAGNGDPQARDASGTSLRTDGGTFAIVELAYGASLPLFGDNVPGTYKLGGWYHDGVFADQRFDGIGKSLAALDTQTPADHRGDYGFYAMADQLLLRDGSGDQGLDLFLRLGAAPDDRNLIAFHVDSGLTYAGLVPSRPNDVVGFGISFEEVGGARRALGEDARLLSRLPLPTPDFESALELSYQAQIAPWWVLQPDMQLILHPGARLTDARAAPQSVPDDALVLGLRTAISL